jgi:hypothetical protein
MFSEGNVPRPMRMGESGDSYGFSGAARFVDCSSVGPEGMGDGFEFELVCGANLVSAE